MNDQQQSRADALTDDQRQMLGEALTEYFTELDRDIGIDTPDRILSLIDYHDDRFIDDLIDRAIVPALSISANETGAEGAQSWTDGYRAALNVVASDVRALFVNYVHCKGADGLLERCKKLHEQIAAEADRLLARSRSPAMAAEAPADWRELSRRLYVELFHCDQQMRSTRDEDGEPHWTQSTVVRDVLTDAKAALDLPIGTLGALFAIQQGFGAQAAMAAAAPADKHSTIECQAHSGPDCTECGGTGAWSGSADERAVSFEAWCDRFPEISAVERLRDAWQEARAAASPAAEADKARTGDVIARSKRILALVDDYHENPTADTRTTLRKALMDEFEAAPQPAQADERAVYAKGYYDGCLNGPNATQAGAGEGNDVQVSGDGFSGGNPAVDSPARDFRLSSESADERAAFDLTDSEWLDVFDRVNASIPNVFGSYMKVRAAFAREAIRLADEARATASPAAERVTAALQALSADVHTLGDGWANDEAMIGLAKKYLRVEPKPASPELSLWRDFVLLAVTDTAPQPAQADAPAEAREPIAWVTDDDRAITAAQKQRALADGGATASSVRPYSIPCYAVSAPADAGEAREPIGPHDLSTTAGGRSYVAEFFAKRLRRHDFGRYITGQLAADFACSLAAYLRDHDHAAADAGEAQPYAYVAPVSNYATRNKIVADRIGGLIPVYTAQPAARVASLTDAARDMLAERRRQVEVEGWTPKHDDEHDKGEMARAAACYALHAGSCFAWRADAYQSAKPHEGNPAAQNSLWPWDMKWWKPKDPRRDLVRAGALILAELERLDRATLLNGADKS